MTTTTESKNVGFIAGAFDLGPHAGHVMMLRECAAHCDFLVVGLHIDPSKERKEKNRPVESAYERFIKLSGCKYIDRVIPYESEEDLYDIHYINRNHGFSSSGLRKRITSLPEMRVL